MSEKAFNTALSMPSQQGAEALAYTPKDEDFAFDTCLVNVKHRAIRLK